MVPKQTCFETHLWSIPPVCQAGAGGHCGQRSCSSCSLPWECLFPSIAQDQCPLGCLSPQPGPSSCICIFQTPLKQRLENSRSEHGSGGSCGQGLALCSIALTLYMGPGTRIRGAFVQGIPLSSLEKSRNHP